MHILSVRSVAPQIRCHLSVQQFHESGVPPRSAELLPCEPQTSPKLPRRPTATLPRPGSSQVRNGHETFVQSGWLRASERKLATTDDNMFKQPSTLLQRIPTMRASDAQSMPQNHYTRVVIPLYFQAHAYRAGSPIRVTISAPNGAQPIWSEQ